MYSKISFDGATGLSVRRPSVPIILTVGGVVVVVVVQVNVRRDIF